MFYETQRLITQAQGLPHVLTLSQINPIHALPSYILTIHLNIILPSMPRSSKWSLSPRSPPPKASMHLSSKGDYRYLKKDGNFTHQARQLVMQFSHVLLFLQCSCKVSDKYYNSRKASILVLLRFKITDKFWIITDFKTTATYYLFN
jgi:hypothetical protein